MYHAITPERMQALERTFMQESGVLGLDLMEKAATEVTDILETLADRGAVFLCGPGNNGGDGYAIARLWTERGHKSVVWTFSDTEQLKGDAQTNWKRCIQLGIPVLRLEALPDTVPDDCDILVDALFGTGLDRPLDGLYAEAVRWMNESELPVLAVDMPSGTAELMVEALETVTFHQRKTTHMLFPGRRNAGVVTVADIGIPQAVSSDDFEVLEPGDVADVMPSRPLDAHKGMAGHALLLAGSYGMAGAAGLAANAAVRGGAGLVTVACPDAVIPIVQVLAPCATCVPLEGAGGIYGGMSAIGVGPGLGHASFLDALLDPLRAVSLPQVWDADALNWLASHPMKLSSRFVLTPHPGEAARLLGTSTGAIMQDPVAATEALHAKYDATILLKGATTVIIGEGRRALNVTGSPGMATGGSGDVLTGIILALLSQGLAPFEAAQVGALVHGMAGKAAAEWHGIRSMNAQDILSAMHLD